MLKHLHLKSLFLLLCLLVGNTSVWAEDETYASWSFTSESYPSNKTNFSATGGSCTESTFYLNGTGAQWNSTKGYAFTAVTDITLTLKLAQALPAGSKLTFSADTYYNKASNAPMKGFSLTASENGGTYATTGLSVTSLSLSSSSTTKTCVYTTQSALSAGQTVAIKYTQTGQAGSGQGYFNNIIITGPKAVVSGTTADPSISGGTPFLDNTTVTITNAASASGADIYYTLNGDDPTTTTSATCFAYTAPFTVDATTTVKAIAKKSTDTNASSVVSKTFTKVTPITVTEALTAINALANNGTIANQCVSGIVCTEGTVSSGAITYFISADGTETNRLQVYKGKGLNNADFENATDIAVGDEVVIYGTLKNYNGNTPEFDAGSYLLSKVRKPTPELAWSTGSYTANYGGSITYPTLTNNNSVTVTYSSSNTNVATIDASTGDITLKANGKTDIKASFAGNETYSPQEVSYELTVAGMLEAPGFSFAKTEVNMTYDEDYEGQALTNPNNVTVTYESSDDDVAEVDENEGTLILYKAGTVTITAKFDGNATYAAGTVSYTINVTKAAAGLVFANVGPFKVAPDADFDVPALTNPHSLTVNWSSTDEDVATADGSTAVIGSKLGTTIIKASFDGDDRYEAGEASYTIVVTNDVIVTWDLSTDQTATATTSSMTWTNSNVTMAAAKGDASTNTNNYYPGTSGQSYTSTRFYKNSTLTITPQNGFAIKSIVFTATTVGYANALSGSDWTNAKATASTTTEPYTVTVTPVNGTSAVSAKMGNTNGHTSVVVNLTKAFEVKLNASGYATLAAPAPLDFSDDSEYSAWQITGISGTSITFAQITGTVAQGTGILLKGTASETISIPVVTIGTDISTTNKLVGVTTAKDIEAGKYYGLSGDKFVKVKAGTVPAGKALLPASEIPASARELMFIFEDETTGITTLKTFFNDNKAMYNLKGQRIDAPRKGEIYIMGGKKMVKK